MNKRYRNQSTVPLLPAADAHLETPIFIVHIFIGNGEKMTTFFISKAPKILGMHTAEFTRRRKSGILGTTDSHVKI